jgi:hypothetical protein
MMSTDFRSFNELTIEIGCDERLYFRPNFLVSRRVGRSFLPKWIRRAPISRIFHGCYWLAQLTGAEKSEKIKFVGPSITGNFKVLKIGEQERYFVNLRNFVGIRTSLKRGVTKPLATHFRGLLSLHCWLIGHPLPVIFYGPAEVILYGQNLTITEECNADLLISQIVSFDAAKPFNVLPLLSDGGVWTDFSNGLTFDSRINVKNGWLLYEQVNPARSSFRILRTILAHFLLSAFISGIIVLVQKLHLALSG